MTPQFDHEKLKVYHTSVEFVAWAYQLFDHEDIPSVLRNQLERSAVSIPLNIAEGNGKSSSRGRCRYLETARGSALESAAALDVLAATGHLSVELTAEGKTHLREVVSMLIGLIKTLSANRVREADEGIYGPANG